jgi:predicted nucleotidyltransferase
MGREVVLTALVGSHMYNLNRPSSDKDYKHFVLPTFEDLYKKVSFTTTSITDTVDYEVHDVRRLGEFLWKANPAYLQVLYSTDYQQWVDGLSFLLLQREKWSTMNLWGFFMATYGTHKEKMASFAKNGWDTKQAGHALRLLFLLERYAKTGDMAHMFWFEKNDWQRGLLLDVLNGKYSQEEFTEYCEAWKAEKLEDLKSFYNAQPTLTSAHEELEERMFRFVEASLMGL